MASELTKRILTAVVLAPLAVWWLVWAPSPWFETLLGVLGAALLIELSGMLSLPMRAGFTGAALAALGLLLAGQHATLVIVGLGLLWMGGLAWGARGASIDALEVSTRNVAMAYWLAVWVLLFAWALLLAFRLPYGRVFLLGAFAGVWAADIAAYVVGRRWGRRRLCRPISPGKSVEGALAGVVLGGLVAATVWTMGARMPAPAAIGLGLMLAVASVLGDLAESAIKRVAGVKDSGALLPGHGGLLDRVDGLMPAVTVATLVWTGL